LLLSTKDTCSTRQECLVHAKHEILNFLYFQLASQYGRYGYRRITAFLRDLARYPNIPLGRNHIRSVGAQTPPWAVYCTVRGTESDVA
jgi:hypothetical protein